MSSTAEETECPQCGYGNALYEMETKSLQESLFCDRCGYSWMSKPKGAFRIRETSETRGYGVLRLTYNGRPMVLDAFRSKPSQRQIEEMKREFSDPSIDLSKSYLTLWDEDAKRLVLMSGELSKE
jgi:ribosomal protein S27AE